MNKSSPKDSAVIIALGSNLPGDFASPLELLEAAIDRLTPAGLRVISRSRLWRSAAWPDPTQPEYLNVVTLVETAREPIDILHTLHSIEADFGRQRSLPNEARTLDLDLIAAGRSVILEGDVQVPHPRAHERLFVMGPLAEIAPDWVHPVLGETARELACAASVGRDATPLSP